MTQAKPKLKEQFYPLTLTYSQTLRKAKLTAAEWRIWSYLVSVDPWGDKYHDVETFTIMSQCDCSKATFYRAIAKFQELGLFDFQDKGISFKNEIGTERLREGYLKNETDRSEMRKPETKMRLNSQICENETLNPPPDKASGSSQTIQTFQTPQTGGEKNIFSSEHKNYQEEKSNCSQDTNQQGTNNLSNITQINDVVSNLEINQKATTANSEEDKTSPVRSTKEVKSMKSEAIKKSEVGSRKSEVSPASPAPPSSHTPPISPSPNLTPEITTRLEALNIPLDEAVKKAIATHHLSQIKGALAHIEETSDQIRSPRGVFLYQVPRQEVDKRKDPKEHLTPEFREWYTKAIADGVVIDRAIESLGLYQFREPIVELPDGGQWPWTQVRDGKHLTPSKEELEESLSQHKKIIENLKANSPRYQSSQEKAKRQLYTTPVGAQGLRPKDPNPPEPLPPELETQLKKMGIPLNDIVKKAISTHPLNQIEAILTIVKEKLKAIGESGGYNAQKLFIYHLMTT